MRYKIRKAPADPLARLISEFEARPSNELLSKVHELTVKRKIPKAEYSTVAVLGHFAKTYFREYQIPPTRDPNQLRQDFVDLDEVVSELGAAKVLLCIEALFGPDMEWAKTKSIKLLTKRSNREKLLLPLVAKGSSRKTRGEFSEFRGERSGDFTVRRI